jgi:hypothetical protein
MQVGGWEEVRLRGAITYNNYMSLTHTNTKLPPVDPR